MLSNAKIGQRVRVHYRRSMATAMPLHSQIGTIVVPGKGRPRNHLVEIEGRVYVIPAGNLDAADAPAPIR